MLRRSLLIRNFLASLLILAMPMVASSDALTAKTKLMNKSSRPTVEEVLSAFGGSLTRNPFEYTAYNQFGGDLQAGFRNKLFMVIAQIEKAYPGALILGLGRDSAHLVDGLDAFYISRGQHGRVRYVEASTDTFSNNPSSETIFKFLENYGVDRSKLLTGRPIVILDGTRYNNGSQSRRLARAIYTIANKDGISSRQLIRRVGAISTAFDGNAYYPKNGITSTNLNDFFSGLERTTKAGEPAEILSMAAWNLTHGNTWTNTFGPLRTLPNGRVDSTKGALTEDYEREAMLSHQFKIIEMATSSEFFAKVEAAAKNMGFNIKSHLNLYKNNMDAKAPAIAEVPQEKPKAPVKLDGKQLNALFETTIRDHFSKLAKLGDSYKYKDAVIGGEKIKLTDNGIQVMQVLLDATFIEAPLYSEMAYEVLLKLNQDHIIGDREFRRLLIQILDQKPIANPKLISRIQSDYKSAVALEITLGRFNEREKYSKLKGNAGVNYRAIVKNIPLSCKFAYGK